MAKEYKAAWERLFDSLPADEQELILASPEGEASAVLAERAMEQAANEPSQAQAFPKGRW